MSASATQGGHNSVINLWYHVVSESDRLSVSPGLARYVRAGLEPIRLQKALFVYDDMYASGC